MPRVHQENVFPVGTHIWSGRTHHLCVYTQAGVRARVMSCIYMCTWPNKKPCGFTKVSRYTVEISAFAITGSHRGPESSDRPWDLNKRLQQKFLLRDENDAGG